MRRLLLLFCCAPLLMASMCEDQDDVIEPIDNCTGEAVAGLNVIVRDENTGEVLTDGVSITAQDDDYSEILQLVDGSSPATFAGAWERAGTYILTVQKSGYVTFLSNGIVVTANQCHVNGQTVNIELTPL